MRFDGVPYRTAPESAVSVTVGCGNRLTRTDALAEPPGPWQFSVKSVAAANAPVEALPAVALLPVQPPEAVQDVALLEFQDNVAASPVATEAGFTVSETVGTGKITVTVALWAAVPPAPAQASANTLVSFSAPVDSVPDNGFAPLQAPDAAQSVAFALLQDSVALPPSATLDGFAESCSVGLGGGGTCSVTTMDLWTLPPGPVHSNVNVTSDPSAPVASLPLTVRGPDHAPDAVQLVALVLDHDSNVPWPF
jgi:hypothetical protein